MPRRSDVTVISPDWQREQPVRRAAAVTAGKWVDDPENNSLFHSGDSGINADDGVINSS